MSAVEDAFVLTLTSGVAGSLMQQTFTYYMTETDGFNGSLPLAETFRDDVLPSIANIVSTVTAFAKIECVNLYDNTDFAEISTDPVTGGARTGQALPFFNAAAFKSAKPTTSQQPARKRFGYLSESDVQGQGLQNNAGYFAALDACAAALSATLDADDQVFIPCIVQRVKITPPSGSSYYRFPTYLGESATFPAGEWTWTNIVTSQITRKFGRGI